MNYPPSKEAVPGKTKGGARRSERSSGSSPLEMRRMETYLYKGRISRVDKDCQAVRRGVRIIHDGIPNVV
jgi:hypothetical protein